MSTISAPTTNADHENGGGGKLVTVDLMREISFLEDQLDWESLDGRRLHLVEQGSFAAPLNEEHQGALDRRVRTCHVVGRKLVGLQEIHFCYRRRPSIFPVNALTLLLVPHTATLERLCIIQETSFVGTLKDYQSFCNVLGTCVNLKELRLDYKTWFMPPMEQQQQRQGMMRMMHHTDTDTTMFDDRNVRNWLLMSLQSLHKLESLELHHVEGSLCWEPLAQLCCQQRGKNNNGLKLSIPMAKAGEGIIPKNLVRPLFGGHQQSSLVELVLGGGCQHLNDEIAEEVSQWLAHNNDNTLKKLVVTANNNNEIGAISTKAAVLLVEALEDNTVLEELELTFSCRGNKATDGDSTHRLTPAIQKRQCLQKLHLKSYEVDENDKMASLAHILRGIALNTSCCLTDVSLQAVLQFCNSRSRGLNRVKSWCSTEIKEIEQTLLATNTSLCSLQLLVSAGDNSNDEPRVLPLTNKTSFGLDLNRAGRRRLLDQPLNRKLWMETLIDQKANVRITFHFLLLNPSILGTTAAGSCRRIG